MKNRSLVGPKGVFFRKHVLIKTKNKPWSSLNVIYDTRIFSPEGGSTASHHKSQQQCCPLRRKKKLTPFHEKFKVLQLFFFWNQRSQCAMCVNVCTGAVC